MISPTCNGLGLLEAKFPYRNIYFHCFTYHHKVFSDPQQGYEYLRFFCIICWSLQMWTSCDHFSKIKSWILYRLRSTQNYPHFEDFFIDQRWLKFRIFDHNSTPCVIDNVWLCKVRWKLQSVEHFRERFIPKQSLCIFKVFIFKRNLIIIILIRTRSCK